MTSTIDSKSMSKSHAIQVPPELLSELLQAAMEEYGIKAGTVTSVVAHKVARWAADEQLKRVSAWLYGNNLGGIVNRLEDAMRPKSLVEQGLEILSPSEGPIIAGTPEYRLTEFQAEVLRAALNRLDKLENRIKELENQR
jgi:hypothetical protein